MPPFAPLNAFNNYLIEELNMRDINNEIIKDVFKDALFFTNFLEPLLKELTF